ncbi:hypothetical protein AUEXF2481DRAFT_596942 [Aureobasidium subglaciale EXF-2481]|uniref:Uncharacterized protein n=1 Tax=Aureobasidium subglaciale (strain EXF-2481) TaxID=1043005 RepID=A0A074YI72_AURSE|nr:uncharacterized protein AUEXF2481DRAFT_596942 [Aureobasidium subglaciale EXF-2481]KEQ97410.1 hypothetical protein AUEXF2481DRAFT_596942 [Aureobasidium subglaciale EXF-2481]
MHHQSNKKTLKHSDTRSLYRSDRTRRSPHRTVLSLLSKFVRGFCQILERICRTQKRKFKSAIPDVVLDDFPCFCHSSTPSLLHIQTKTRKHTTIFFSASRLVTAAKTQYTTTQHENHNTNRRLLRIFISFARARPKHSLPDPPASPPHSRTD